VSTGEVPPQEPLELTDTSDGRPKLPYDFAGKAGGLLARVSLVIGEPAPGTRSLDIEIPAEAPQEPDRLSGPGPVIHTRSVLRLGQSLGPSPQGGQGEVSPDEAAPGGSDLFDH
jgi:hypothetical protein